MTSVHGLAVGLLCAPLLKANGKAAPDRVAFILEAMKFSDSAEGAEWILSCVKAAGLSPSLSALGVPRTAFGEIIDQAENSDRLKNNPGSLSGADLTHVLEEIA